LSLTPQGRLLADQIGSLIMENE